MLLGFVSASSDVLAADTDEPLRELFDFARVTLAPGASTSVLLSVPPSVLSRVTAAGTEQLVAGEYTIELGGEQLGDSNTLRTTLRMVGETRTVFSLGDVTERSNFRRT